MRLGTLASRRQLIVRIRILLRRDIVFILFAVLLILGSRFVSVYVRDAVAAVSTVSRFGRLEILVVVGG